MNSSDLIFARDKQTNAIIGGGYTLNSSFLNANISPFVQMKGGARSRNRRNRSDKSDRSDRSDKSKSYRIDRSDRSDSDHDDDRDELKVSTLLERANSNKFIIPAGIFMMHPSSHQEEEKEKEPVPMSTKLKDFIYSADHNTNDDNYDHQEQVVSSDLYEKLLSMISPADKKRYWDPKSTTRKRGNRNQDVTPSSIKSKSKTRRKV